MERVKIRSYRSPTLVLLAFDWETGGTRDDFLGFAIQREPGFAGAPASFLPNRLTFDGMADPDAPSDGAPIQKFMWWDAHIGEADRGSTFTYTIWPVVGRPGKLHLLKTASRTVQVTLPHEVEQGIGTFFNRAVVSSQSFSAQFGTNVSKSELPRALRWLANGLQDVVPGFLKGSPEVEGSIYHLSDEWWVIPALKKFGRPASLVYHSHVTGADPDHANDDALEELDGKVEFKPRHRSNIMHDKFLVRESAGSPTAVLMGSANFTTEGLSTQANLLHTFESAALSQVYLDRKRLLQDDPTLGKTAEHAGWSPPIVAGDAIVRAFFPPEPKATRTSLDAVVQAVQGASSSVFFCLFKPTDPPLAQALSVLGQQGKVMMGLINELPKAESPAEGTAADLGTVELYQHGWTFPGIVDHEAFVEGNVPKGFWWEHSRIPALKEKFPVYIHHKFVLVDPESASPTIYTGSANMSENSVHNNDENLLEITGSPRLAGIYLAEFLRLYEHYRARMSWNARDRSGAAPPPAPAQDPMAGFRLQPDSGWAEKFFRPDSSWYRSRTALARPPEH